MNYPEKKWLVAVAQSDIHLGQSRATPRATLSVGFPGSVPAMPDQQNPLSPSVTQLLAKAVSGDSSALANVFPLIYDELHRLAQAQLKREPDGHTLSPTALVHEAYMRLIDYSRMEWTGKAHFMAVASTAMRRILVDHARSHRSVKRGGALQRVPIEAVQLGTEERADLLIAVDDALGKLKELDPRQARVVECRFFGGMTEEETAEALGIGLRTAKRDWAKAKAWLHKQISSELAG
jgi:RNA polymerase sigma factor (TIGR02999 family)